MTKTDKKRALIWNAHWQTVGGGERYALAVVKSLLELNYDVLVAGICDNPNSLLQEKFGENLGEAQYVKVMGETAVKDLALQSDIFINASFGSVMVAPISNSYFICHFPEISRRSKIKKKLFSTRKNMAFDVNGSRLFPDKNGNLICTHDSYLKNEKCPNIVLREANLDVEIEDSAKGENCVLVSGAKYVAPDDSLVKISGQSVFGVLVENLDPPDIRSLIFRRFEGANSFFLSYKKIFANSRFTAHWIKQNWGIESFILFPPVKIGYGKDEVFLERKSTKILSVGRFVDPKHGHSKNQIKLIEAFSVLSKKSAESYELHLAGGVDARNQKYFNKVKRFSKDKNVFLHPNVSAEELDYLFKTSSFFWHGAGIGVPRNEPEKMEHFGISVVEAIGNGLVPIVFDCAGPAEILVDFPELRFQNYTELAAKTMNASEISAKKLDALFLIPKLYDERMFFSEFSRFIEQ